MFLNTPVLAFPLKAIQWFLDIIYKRNLEIRQEIERAIKVCSASSGCLGCAVLVQVWENGTPVVIEHTEKYITLKQVRKISICIYSSILEVS